MDSDDFTQEHLNIIRLYRAENVGPASFKKLIAMHQTASNAIDALPEHAARGGMKRQITIPEISQIEAEIEATFRFGASFLFEATYPESLKTIPDSPPFLIAKGNRDLLDEPLLGMIGSRNASPQALKFAHRFAKAAGKEGWCAISGLARGIDTASHMGSIETGTIAAIAGGIDNIYPPRKSPSLSSVL